jgi:transcriptional regulator with XRE-family HTH domain
MDSGRQLNTNPKLSLLNELGNREYRRGFVEAHATDTIAFQIRQLRKALGWEQRDLARELGNPKLQPMVSRYENPDYGKYSVATLLELAAAFDVALVVRFAPFSELVEWDFNARPEKMAPPRYSKDSGLSSLAESIKNPHSSTGKLAAFGEGKEPPSVGNGPDRFSPRGEFLGDDYQWENSQGKNSPATGKSA